MIFKYKWNWEEINVSDINENMHKYKIYVIMCEIKKCRGENTATILIVVG